MPRITRKIYQVEMTYNEVQAAERLITNFLNFYYLEERNNKTWRKWMGGIRPRTLESLERTLRTILKDRKEGKGRGG